MKIEILSEDELLLLKKITSEAQRIVICCHKNPDGDAMGSSLAWAEFITMYFDKQPVVIIPDAYPDFLKWLPNTEKVIRYDKHKEDADKIMAEAELIFCLDFNASHRLEDMQGALDNSKAKRIVIDHHLNPDMETVLTVSDTSISSTSELIFRIIWQLGGFDIMTTKCAMSIYCGMMTDTGGFTYNSSSPEIYLIISHLLSKGIDKDDIYNKVFHNYSSWCIRMRGYIMYQKLNVIEDLHSSYFIMTKQDLNRFHFKKGDAEGLVNEPLKIKGMKMSISLREDLYKPNYILVSLRSSCGFHCDKVASKFFNGGGHADAAGGKLYCSVEEAEKIAREAICYYAEELR